MSTRINLESAQAMLDYLWLPLDFLFIEKVLYCINSAKCMWPMKKRIDGIRAKQGSLAGTPTGQDSPLFFQNHCAPPC